MRCFTDQTVRPPSQNSTSKRNAMTATVAQLSCRLLSRERYMKILEQRQWLQDLLKGFRLSDDIIGATSSASPIVLPYGSIISGTSFADGDADYAVAFPLSTVAPEQLSVGVVAREKQEAVLSDLFSHIRAHNTTVELQPQRIFRARIPIVQYVCKGPAENSKFDLSLSIDGLKNSLLLRAYMTGDPRLRLGVLCAKQWGRDHKILNARRGWISPYALTILYIYFMRATGRTQLSVSEETIAARVQTVVKSICGAHGSIESISEFETTLPLQEYDLATIEEDVFAFFGFYGDSSTFDFDTSVVDIRLRGGFKSKDEWVDAIRGLSDEERWHLLGHENVLLRDPFEPHSLGRSVDFFRGEEIRERFRTAALKRESLTFLKS